MNSSKFKLVRLEVAGPSCRFQVELVLVSPEFLRLQTAQLLVLVIELLVQFRQIQRLQLGRRLERRLSPEHEVILLVAADLELFLAVFAVALARVLLVLVFWGLVLAEEVIVNITIVPEQLSRLGSQVRQPGYRLLWTLSRLFENTVVSHVLSGRCVTVRIQLLFNCFEGNC